MKPPHRFYRGLRIVLCTGVVALLAQAGVLEAQEPSWPPPQSKFADAGGVRLHYVDFGGEGLPVILVPAVTRDATHYDPLGPLLTGGNRVLAITRRGDGESEDPGGPYDARTQARDFLHFMDALGIPQAVFVSNVGDEITYLAEEHPHRVAGVVFLGGPARGPSGKAMKSEPTGMHEALQRLWQVAAGVPPDYDGYVPRYLESAAPTIDAPALVFVAADGMRGVEHENPGLMMVGSPLTAEIVRNLRPEDGRAHFEQLATDPQYRDRTLAEIPDSVARSYFQRLATDADLQAQAHRFHTEAFLPAEIAHWGAFRRAFAGGLDVVELELPAVSGYEYNSDPELIAPHLRRFLEELRPAGGADTVHVAPPTGDRESDRASTPVDILPALEQADNTSEKNAPPPSVREGELEMDDGVRLYYKIEGEGPDTLVVLHGGPSLGHAYLAPDLLPLARGRVVIHYDQRGIGRSSPLTDPARLSVEHHVQDLEGLRVHLGLERMDLLGHSWGGMLAAHYAATHPHRVRRILLLDPMVPARDPFMAMAVERAQALFSTRFDEAERDRLGALAAAAEAGDPDERCREMFSLLTRAYFDDPATRSRGDFCGGTPETLRIREEVDAAILGSLGAWDVRPVLGRVRSPVLVVHGAAGAIPPEAMEAWAEAFPDAQLLAIDRAGHYPHVDRPEVFFPAAEIFFGGGWPEGRVPPQLRPGTGDMIGLLGGARRSVALKPPSTQGAS